MTQPNSIRFFRNFLKIAILPELNIVYNNWTCYEKLRIDCTNLIKEIISRYDYQYLNIIVNNPELVLIIKYC